MAAKSVILIQSFVGRYRTVLKAASGVEGLFNRWIPFIADAIVTFFQKETT